MLEVTRTATFTDEQPDGEALTTIVARSVLEAALAEDEPGRLWFEVGDDEHSQALRDRSLHGRSRGAAAAVGQRRRRTHARRRRVAGLFDDPDVEGHGMKGAIAIAVTSAALLAPAGRQR